MRLGQVIGKTTLSISDSGLKGGCFLLVQPLSREQFSGAPLLPLAKGATVVVYDGIGAAEGQIVGFTEGAEAAAPFFVATPVDAYASALVDQIHYSPLSA